MSFSEEIFTPEPIVLAVFGQSTTLTDTDLHHEILHPLLAEWERPPDTILLPTESKTGADIQDWAETLHLRTTLFHSDWKRNGRIAQVLRDDRMIKECTHALIFLTTRTKRLESFAEKWARKGKTVFTWHPEHRLVQLQIETDPEPASTPAHKSDKGTMLTWLKCQTTESH